nr:SNF2-related protein [Poseidonibacter ostreae]
MDLNPHQVEASLFAFKSPLQQGVILADEVGLGKTIEAGLVLCQYWSERKRKIIIIAPASLRKQWSMELKEKFFIDSIIIDGSTFKEEIKRGNRNPFIQKDKVVITSYPFASRKEEFIFLANFQLAVLDEAHKLRNFHRGDKAKQAYSIHQALRETKKVLLTATPLQNSLLEIYGLVSLIDPFVFGDKKAFSKQFNSGSLTTSDINDLKDRLKPIVHRTLRKDVLEYIQYTKRIPLVEEFIPTDDEITLYNLISDFLLNENLYSIPAAQRNLITLVARKLLASSTKAIMGTLETMIKRLENIVINEKIKISLLMNFDDEEELTEDYIEEENIDEELEDIEISKEDIINIQDEIEQLKSFIDIAKSIEVDTKVKALLSALEKGFEEQNKLGANKKAIIFTESRRTQEFLFEYLEDNGFKDKVVLFNGTNTDAKSKDIYKDWIEKYQETDRCTGSKASDMKQAIVDYFKETADIIIATEAGSEGINLQFCNMLINYDLPWNPQRIEQRIGRVHRYGQKHDVVVINFINKKNEADRRVHELLSQKFKLFEGVFGASDEVLGAIQSGVDFEKRILKIYQTCRSQEEIENAFNELQDEFSSKINEKTLKTREKLLEHFDEDVHLRLKDNLDKTTANIDKFSEYLYNIANIELEEYADFTEDGQFILNRRISTDIPLGKYTISRQNHDDSIHTLRLSSNLGSYIIDTAMDRELNHTKLIFDLTNHKYKISTLEKYKGKSGYLSVSKITINSYDTEEYLVITALTSDYKKINEETASKLFSIKAKSTDKMRMDSNDLKQLEVYYESQKDIIINLNEKTNSEHFSTASIKLHKWSDDKLNEVNKDLKETKLKIKELNRQSSSTSELDELEKNQLAIKEQEKKRRKIQRDIFDIEEQIEEQRDALIEELKLAKKQTIIENKLFTYEWEIR